MSKTYEDVLKRLREERKRLSWSQREMSQCVHMSQSNYSKVELGLRRLSFSELRYLCDSEIDVHYVYTGCKCTGEYREFFSSCTYSELVCFLSILYSVVLLRYREDVREKWKNVLERICYAAFLEENQSPGEIFLSLRRRANLQQQKMAERIGVDVKKLRDLENGRSLPDSELLCRIYEIFAIPPLAFFKDKAAMEKELEGVLEMLNEESRKRIIVMLKTLHEN